MMAAVILILSTALFFFYLQGVCQKILRRQFAQSFWLAIANANGFEFPLIRKSLEESDIIVRYPEVETALRCDFQSLTYLAKNAVNVNQRYTCEERFLILYGKYLLLSLVTRRWLRLGQKPVVLRLTSILQYFANVVGERANVFRSENLTTSDYLLGL